MSLRDFPGLNFTTLVASILMGSPVCGFRPSRSFRSVTVKGDVTVDANGFELKNATIQGNLTFTKDEYKQSAEITEGTVTGQVN